MSYNINKVGSKQPDQSSNINIGLDDLGNVENIGLGEGIVYNESLGTWGPATFGTGIAGFNLAIFGQGEAANYVGCGYATNVGETLCFYDSNPVNLLESNITFNYVDGTSWMESITLTPGKYEIFMQTDVTFSGSGYFGFILKDTLGNSLSQLALIGNVQTSYGHPTAIMTSLDLTETTTIHAEITNTLGVASNTSQGNVPSQHGVILIRSL